MTGFVDSLLKIPRLWLFILAALVQVGLIAAMVIDRAAILRQGTEVKLKARPIDPRDFLRGDYVALSYDISSLAAGPLTGAASSGEGSTVVVKLAPKADGFYEAVSVNQEMVPLGGEEVAIRGHVTSGASCGDRGRTFCDRLQLSYGIERYFVPEGEGREIEAARNKGAVAIVAAVTSSGRAEIKRLLIDGKPVYDEPLF
jgi:uncharacterized membrane-anchored protein